MRPPAPSSAKDVRQQKTSGSSSSNNRSTSNSTNASGADYKDTYQECAAAGAFSAPGGGGMPMLGLPFSAEVTRLSISTSEALQVRTRLGSE